MQWVECCVQVNHHVTTALWVRVADCSRNYDSLVTPIGLSAEGGASSSLFASPYLCLLLLKALSHNISIRALYKPDYGQPRVIACKRRMSFTMSGREGLCGAARRLPVDQSSTRRFEAVGVLSSRIHLLSRFVNLAPQKMFNELYECLSRVSITSGS